MKYLIAGNIYMPADSMHSTIESFISNKMVYAPSQWPTVTSLSRLVPGPYQDYSLNYKDIEDWVTYEETSKIIPNTSKPNVLNSLLNKEQNREVIETLSSNNLEQDDSSFKTTKTKNKSNNKLHQAKRLKREPQGKPLRISEVRSITFNKNSNSLWISYSYIKENEDLQEFGPPRTKEGSCIKKML